MKVLVTGASGFIGSTFLRRFAAREDVSLCGVGRRERIDLPASVRYCALALDRLDELDFVPDVVIHAAGRASPWGTPREYTRENVETTRQVIDFCNRRNHPRLIFISSAAVYYRFAHRLNIRECDPIGPGFTSEYGCSLSFHAPGLLLWRLSALLCIRRRHEVRPRPLSKVNAMCW